MKTRILIILSAVLISFIFLSQDMAYGAQEEQKSQLENAWNLYDKEKYSESFPIFNYLCIKQNYIPACYGLALSYKRGLGVTRDSKMALDLFGFMEYVYAENKREYQKELAALQKANVYEDMSKYQEAKRIYFTLSKSNNEEIKSGAEKGIRRENIYKFLSDLFSIIPSYDNKNVNVYQLEDMFNTLNMNDIPQNALKYFIAYKDGVIKYKKYLDTRQDKALDMIGKGLASDFSVIFDAYNAVKDVKSRKNNMNATRQNFQEFLTELIKDGVSHVWISEKLRSI